MIVFFLLKDVSMKQSFFKAFPILVILTHLFFPIVFLACSDKEPDLSPIESLRAEATAHRKMAESLRKVAQRSWTEEEEFRKKG